MLDNRTQNMRIGVIGNKDRHGCREQAYKDGAYEAPGAKDGAYVAPLRGTEFTLRAAPLVGLRAMTRNTCLGCADK